MAQEWRKVVYGGMQQGFADNYTDSSFLEGMVMNASVVRRDFWGTVLDSVVISQYLAVVAIIACVWTYTLTLRLPAATLLSLDAFFLALGFLIWLATIPSVSSQLVFTSALNLCYFVCALYVMTPIFHTLTRSISSDSIWACAVCLLIVHLFFHDYSCASSQSRTRSSISLSDSSSSSSSVLANIAMHASIVASVLIASRLPSRDLVFATMLFSLEFFLLFPFVSCSLKRQSGRLHLAVSGALVGAALCLLFRLSGLGFLALAAAVIFITFICPLWLLRIQKFKFEINGPWDEAKLCFDIDKS